MPKMSDFRTISSNIRIELIFVCRVGNTCVGYRIDLYFFIIFIFLLEVVDVSYRIAFFDVHYINFVDAGIRRRFHTWCISSDKLS